MMPAQEFREALIESVAQAPERPVLLSGGMDSTLIAVAAAEVGGRPPAFTFVQENRSSVDVSAAIKVASHLGLLHYIVRIPSDYETVKRDVYDVLRITGSARKVHVQTCVPMLRAARILIANGHDEAWVGLSIDDLGGVGREFDFERSRSGHEGWTDMRWRAYHDPTESDWKIEKVMRHCGVTMADAYRTERMERLMLSLTYEQMHRPRPKFLWMLAFPQFFRAVPIYRRPANYQVESGTRDLHDRLFLADPALNRRGAKDVAVVYREMLGHLQEEAA